MSQSQRALGSPFSRVVSQLVCVALIAAPLPQLASASEAEPRDVAYTAEAGAGPAERRAPVPDPASELERARPRQPGVGIQEIVVTVRKRAERLQQTPLSAVAVTDKAMAVRNITTLDNLGEAVAGLKLDTVENSNSDGRIYIRGVGQDLVSTAVDPGVGLYEDGVYLPRLTGSILNLGDVERVEVLRGPQGTLYGKNTIGGVVNVITRKPGPELESEAFVRAGNLGRLDSNVSVNVPLSERLLTRLSLSTRTQDGFVKSVREGDRGGDDKLLSGRFQLSWLPSENLELNLAVEGLQQNEKLPLAQCRQSSTPALTQQAFLVNNTTRFPEACSRSTNLFDQERSTSEDIPKQKQDIFGLRSTVQWDGSAFSLTSNSSFRTIKTRTSEGDADAVDANAVRFQPAFSQFDTVSQELIATGALLDDRLSWTAGLYGLLEKGRMRSGVDVLPDVVRDPDKARILGDPMLFLAGAPVPPELLAAIGGLSTVSDLNRMSAPLIAEFGKRTGVVGDLDLLTLLRTASLRPINDFENLSYAGFGELTYAFTDALSLTGGARYTEERRERQGKLIPAFASVGRLGGPIIGRNQTKHFGRWTGRAILQYTFNEDLTSYVSFGRGFRSGGLNEPSAAAALTGGDPVGSSFGDEVLDSLEVGIKSRWFNNQLVLNLSGYYNKYDDIQLLTFADGALSVPNLQSAVVRNAADATVQGLELDFEGQPSFVEGLTLSGGLSLINAQYDRFRTDRIRPITSECKRLRFSECALDVRDVTTPGLSPADAVSPLGKALLQLTQPIVDRNVDVSDLEFKQTPAFSFNVQARYLFDLQRIGSALGQIDAAAQWYYQGEVFQDTFNNEAAKQGKFGLLNGRLAWNLWDGNTTIGLWGKNLLDRRYVASALDLRDLNGNNQVFLGEPRTYGLELRRRF